MLSALPGRSSSSSSAIGSSPVALACQIFRREGLLGFWRGNGVNLLRVVPFKSLNFFTYDVLRR